MSGVQIVYSVTEIMPKICKSPSFCTALYIDCTKKLTHRSP